MIEFLLPPLAFIVSMFLTGMIRKYALKKNVIDTPNERSSHTVPTPRGGGLAIVLTFYVFLFLFYWTGYIDQKILAATFGMMLIAMIGFIDDHGHIAARYRLMVHFLAAGWSIYWLGPIALETVFEHPLWYWGMLCFTLLYLVWLLNLFNFMDGIDGIASMEAMTVLGSAALLINMQAEPSQSSHGLLLLLTTTACAIGGFLFWNWPPARIFMGDVGSAFLGMLLGVLTLISTNLGLLSFTVWLILLAVFITDASLTLMVRLLNGEKVYHAHRSHAYQHLSRRFGHKTVTTSVLLINLLWLLPLAWLSQFSPAYSGIFLLLAYLPLLILASRNQAGLAV